MQKNSNEWNYEPLDIMCEAFPKLVTTKWYKDQMLIAKQNIGVTKTCDGFVTYIG
ncbi:MAG: hypothetical protein U9Q33_08700 [Campylobacterota bacterium]|nr:hypothetical protein [Campylobacterota bacterium]